MTTSLKDVSSAEMIRTLADMNCFEQECTVYGYGWINEQGKRMYTMSEDALLIQHAFEAHQNTRCCMTPVQQWGTRAILKEETQEDLFLYFKLQLAEQLKCNFNETYFSCMSELLQVPDDNLAQALLLEWQEELDGYFDEDATLLFSGAVAFAYSMKHLSQQQYQAFQIWLQQIRRQISGKIQVYDKFERTFYGIAYQKANSQEYSFLCNANEKTLYNQIWDMDKKGIRHTPVYQRTYWYSRSNELGAVRKKFEEDLRELMDQVYLDRIMMLQSLPSAIPETLWKVCWDRVQRECSEAAIEGILYWGQKWNVFQS